MASTRAIEDREAIEAAVDIIIESPLFRSSKQCQILLRYIVEHTVDGKDDLLRERVIGAEVFRRSPDYDTGNDPVVRSRVGELRKRLAQYYQEHREAAEVSISIPSGSYRAAFQWTALPAKAALIPTLQPIQSEHIEIEQTVQQNYLGDKPPNAPASLGRILTKGWFIGVAVLLLMSCVAFLVYRNHQNSRSQSERLFDKFWEPLANSPKPDVIYIGANYAYRLSTSYLEAYSAREHKPYDGPEFFVGLKNGDSIPEADIIPINNVIGFGDVAATSRIVATLVKFGAKYDLRYGDDLAVTDMRTAPVILIGGFSNPWALQLTKDLRFSLEGGDRVVDHQNKGRIWVAHDGQTEGRPTDYVIISRLVKARTGGFMLIIAGVGTVGNQAAADFLGDPNLVAKLLKDAPAGWEQMNMQAVFSANYIRNIPVATDVKAVYFW
jgi:hypothetical protein